MIGFDSNETAYTEGFIKNTIKDAAKAVANIDIDQVKADAKAMKKSSGATDAVGKFNKLANEDILGPASKQIDKAATAVKSSRLDRKSIIARAKNSILYFPVYVTQTIRVNEANIIANLFERVYASYMQAVLAQNPIINERDANNLLFLKGFHTNINESTDLVLYNEFYTPIDDIDEMMKESVFYREQVTPTMEAIFRAIPCTEQHIILEHKRNQYEHLEKLSYLREDVKTPNEKGGGPKEDVKSQEDIPSGKEETQTREYLKESDLEEMAMDAANMGPIEEKLLKQSEDSIRKEIQSANPKLKAKEINELVKDQLDAKEDLEDQFEKALKGVKYDIEHNRIKDYHFDGARYYKVINTVKVKTGGTKTTTRQSDKKAPDVIKGVEAPKLLRDGDLKKINGILPWTMEVTFRIKGENGELDKDVTYVIGIKTQLHLIRAQDLSEDLREIINGNMKSLQKVRYKTGEISFMDYMFNKKGIKADAAKSINYNKKWLNNLKRLAEWDRINGTLLDTPAKIINGSGNVPIPNATLVLSQTDVTTMMNETGIDLSMANNAIRLCKALFLIAVCIVDSSAGTMRVLMPDQSSEWDVQSLASVDVELSKTDNSQLMRELNRIVNK